MLVRMRLVSLATMLCVNDVERSAEWYRDKLGFEVVESDSEIASTARFGPRLPLRREPAHRGQALPTEPA
jgi:catechol 2,3-dioxygenase-like lactoylglutathione lyase family enzyme